jgi:pyrophosphatase PpaX
MPESLQVKAVIFDLDGTLADTIPLIVASFNAACREAMGRSYTPEEVISRFGIPDAAMVKRELRESSPEIADHAVERFYRHYEQEHDMVSAFDGVTQLLHALQERGVPMGVMTGKGARTAEITLRKLGWQGLFGSVVTGEDVIHQKPHPEGVLKAAQELGINPEECVFIGDSPADIEAGKAAGMTTIGVVWHNFYAGEMRAMQPDFWCETTADLAAILNA